MALRTGRQATFHQCSHRRPEATHCSVTCQNAFSEVMPGLSLLIFKAVVYLFKAYDAFIRPLQASRDLGVEKLRSGM